MTLELSPYSGLSPNKWRVRTLELVRAHPLDQDEIVEIVFQAWDDILASSIGNRPFRIGVDIFPKPQIMAFFLHELIPLELQARYPGLWRGDASADEKDIVCISDRSMSVEIKASSHPSQIFGNRSYAQKPSSTKKSKSGYYLAINFKKFTDKSASPTIRRIRFGWLDHEDWAGQRASTGQQARLTRDADRSKLLELYSV